MAGAATRHRLPFVDLSAQRERLGGALEGACLAALARGDYVLGTDVVAFEEEFAAYCEVAHAIGVDSGTSALELALRAAGIGEGDEVITAANTFVATAFAIVHCGARPVLVDVDPDTYLLDVAQLERAVTRRTGAVIPVHLYGQPADMSAIAEIADAAGAVVIEDACQAHGARDRARRVGGLGLAGAFSFYPAKNLGAHGDGGIVVTDDATIAERVRSLRNYGASAKYRSEHIGFNRRLDTLQAAMLRVKLGELDGWNAERRRIASLYDAALAGLPVVRPVVRDAVEPVWHLYVVRVEDRDGLRARMLADGVETGVHYPLPVHLQPALRWLGYRRGDFPVAEAHADALLSLPMYPEMDESSVTRVVEALATAIAA